MKVIGYARCSTREQATGGHSLALQRDAIEAECRRRGWSLVSIEQDVASGKSAERRHGLQRVLSMLRTGEADTLMALRIDRISRSLSYFSGLLEECGRPRKIRDGRRTRTLPPWRLVLLKEGNGVDTTTEEGEVFLNMMGAWARFELRRISRRVREGLAHARKHPKPGKLPIGRQPMLPDSVRARIIRLRRAGKSWWQIANALEADKVPTAQGGVRWYASTVRKIYLTATLLRTATARKPKGGKVKKS